MSNVLRISDTGSVGIGLVVKTQLPKEEWRKANYIKARGQTYPMSWAEVREEEGKVIVRIPRWRRVETEEAKELQELLERWRARGKGDLADAVEFAPEDGDIWGHLCRLEQEEPEVRVFELAECEFEDRHIEAPSTPLHIQ
jgi:hypothetical protein